VDVESIHDMFGVSWNMPKTWYIWQVCFGKETKKINWKCNEKYLRPTFCYGSQKLGFFVVSNRQQTSLLQMKNQTLEVCCSLCSRKHQGGKANFLLGRKFVLFLFAFYWKGVGWSWSSLSWTFWISLHIWSFQWGHVNFQACKYFQRVDLVLCKSQKKTIVVISGVQKCVAWMVVVVVKGVTYVVWMFICNNIEDGEIKLYNVDLFF